MTMSLSEGLANSCVGVDDIAQMAMPGAPADAMPDHDAPATDRESNAENCPMGAAMATCVASAVAVTPAASVPAMPVSRLAIVPSTPHVPASFVALGLFRPPIA